MCDKENTSIVEQMKLSPSEKVFVLLWTKKLLCVDFEGVDAIKKQIEHALQFDLISFYHHNANIWIGFHLDNFEPLHPKKLGVPISMTAFQENKAPIFFVIHVKNGIIIEIEVGTDDLSNIDINCIDLTNVEYHM